MIDFTGLPVRKKTYSGANGSKISVVYQGELYMLKFPALPTRNPALSYTNSCISEYLGCKIYESVGIPVQEVLLGEYRTPKGSLKTVVACKDFTSPGIVLQDFASMKNQIVACFSFRDFTRPMMDTAKSVDCVLSLLSDMKRHPFLVKFCAITQSEVAAKPR